MQAETLAKLIGADFYTGVPDSQLRAFCDYLTDKYAADPLHHIIAANEGNAAAIAAGYHLATGKIPVVYMQNSGEGNIINPSASLLNNLVYAIPVIFIIGWRGEDGVHDEPQHIFQGQVTLKLLTDMNIASQVIGPQTTEEDITAAMENFRASLEAGKSVAFVVRKNALDYHKKITYQNAYTLSREEALRYIVAAAGEDAIVSTTGKASRELFEIREANGQGHGHDFLTVGSMGHSSSIALGIDLQKPNAQIWCVDGDGALLMHMGAMAVIGSIKPRNLIHIVINNEAHETVGGMPTAVAGVDLVSAARACGYPYAARVDNPADLQAELQKAKASGTLCMLEVKCAIGARADLGRPTTSTHENKQAFMDCLKKL